MRRILALALLAGCSTDPGSQSGSPSDLIGTGSSDCMTHVQLSVSVDSSAASPQVHLAVESCRLDADACVDLCNYEISNLGKIPALVNGIPAPGGFGGLPGGGAVGPGGTFPTQTQSGPLTPDQCHVTFDGETANSDIHYDAYVAGPNCAFATAGASQGSATPGGK